MGTVWICIESTTFFSEYVRDNTQDNIYVLPLAALFAIAYAAWRTRALERIMILLPGSNTKVEILFGNLFDQDHTHIIVPANNHFDGDLGGPVDPNSVHGQFIQIAYQGSCKQFELACDKELSRIKNEKIDGRSKSPSLKLASKINASQCSALLIVG